MTRDTHPVLLLGCTLLLSAVTAAAKAEDCEAKYKRTFTLKNNTGQTANDLHVKFKGVFPNEAQDPGIEKARSDKFSDPPSQDADDPTVFHWPDPDDPSGSVADGESTKIAVCAERNPAIDTEASYWTKDGANIGGVSLTMFKSKWDILESSVSAGYGNESDSGMLLLSLEIYAGNDPELFTIDDEHFPYEVPTGEIIFEAPGQWLEPGDVFVVDLGPVLPDGYYLMLATLAPAEEPDGIVTVASGFLPGASCPADIDGSGAVDVGDLIAVILGWGGGDPAADVNQDGVVDVADLLQVILNWGPC